MRRVNIEAAFQGEGGESEGGEDEGIALSVRGGEVILVVPEGTPDDRVCGAATMARGSLRLENGRVLLFEIHGDAVGAFFEDEPAALFDRRQARPEEGLSTLTSGSNESATFGGAAALMGAGVLAREVMSEDVVTVEPHQTVDEAAGVLSFHDISGMPVVRDGRVVGVVSEADLIGKQGARVEEVMTTPAVTVSPTTPLEQIAGTLVRRGIRRMPVVDAEGRLVGIVSRSDVLRWAASHPRSSAAVG